MLKELVVPKEKEDQSDPPTAGFEPVVTDAVCKQRPYHWPTAADYTRLLEATWLSR